MGARLTTQGHRPKAAGRSGEGHAPKAGGHSGGTHRLSAEARAIRSRIQERTGSARGLSSFVLKNIIVWLLMVVVLVLVPDTLEPWLGIEVARVVGWGVAFPVWMIVVERDWQTRFGPMARVALQVPLWIAAALLAIWISEQAGRRVF